MVKCSPIGPLPVSRNCGKLRHVDFLFRQDRQKIKVRKRWFSNERNISRGCFPARETASLERSGDSFRKIVVVGVPQPKYTDEKGITYVGVMDFLLDPSVLDGLLK